MRILILALSLLFSFSAFALTYEYGSYQTKSYTELKIPTQEVLVKVLESGPTTLRLDMVIVSRDRNFASVKDSRVLKKDPSGKWTYVMGDQFGKVKEVSAETNGKIITSYRVKIIQPSGNIYTMTNTVSDGSTRTRGETHSADGKLLYETEGTAKPVSEAQYNDYLNRLKSFL